MVDAASRSPVADALRALAEILGEGLVTDEAERQLASQDIFYSAARPCLAVLRPADRDQLVRAMTVATAAGLALHPRGAGASYTGGFLPESENALVLDLTRLDRILEVDPIGMTVRVEAGVTWAALRERLAPLGLRTPFQGPLSGRVSTVGAALSQNGVFWGSGLYGTAADSVLGLQVVLADGRLLDTGTGGGPDAPAFLRPYGPDLTGLFLADGGAFGVKAVATLRLLPRAPHQRFASFSFDTADALLAAMSEASRQQLASESFAMDPYLTGLRVGGPGANGRADLGADLAALLAVLRQNGPLAALGVAARGRRFARKGRFGWHLIVEDLTASGAEHRLRRLRGIARRFGGGETADSVPRLMAADPFPRLRGVLGPRGERWAPVHVVLPHAAAAAFYRRFEAWRADQGAVFEALGIALGALCLTVGASACVIEIMMFWPDARGPHHDRLLGPSAAARIPRLPPDPTARAAVEAARGEIIALGQALGAAHLQIGRAYPYRATRDPVILETLAALRAQLDPAGLMNPGVLGFPPPR